MGEAFDRVTANIGAGLESAADNDRRFEKLIDLERQYNTRGQGRRAIARQELEAHRLGRRWLYVRRGEWRRWLESTKVPPGQVEERPPTKIGGAS